MQMENKPLDFKHEGGNVRRGQIEEGITGENRYRKLRLHKKKQTSTYFLTQCRGCKRLNWFKENLKNGENVIKERGHVE